DTQPAKKKPPTTESVDQLDWKKLGLGFGGNEDTPPSFDTEGKAVSGLAKTAQKDPLSLAALRALMVVAGLGRKRRTRSAGTAVVTAADKAADSAVAMPAVKAVATEATAADKPAAEAAVEETAMAAASEDEEPAVGKASDVDAEAEADVGD
ncbi:hypothetical protein PR003_g34338, partial [Phytophthora rubi]